MKKKKESNNRYEKHRPRNTYIHTKRILKKKHTKSKVIIKSQREDL